MTTQEDISADFPFKSNYIEVHGSRLHYVDDGSGDPILFLHGNPSFAKGLGEDEFELRDVPRRAWSDRVAIRVTPLGERRIALAPYPFDQDPLPVSVLARVFDLPADRSGHFQTWWHAKPLEVLEFQFSS